MGTTFSRIFWFLLLVTLLSYATYLVAGNFVHAQASGRNEPVLIRDELGVGVHHLSGMITVPSSCDQLSVRTQEISDNTFVLIFRTWREPSVDCVHDETPRYFRAVLFAPSTGVEFTATLDGAGFPIQVMPALPGHIGFE